MRSATPRRSPRRTVRKARAVGWFKKKPTAESAPASNVRDAWKQVLNAEKLIAESREKIVAKWEKSEREPLELVVVSRERAKRVLEEEKNQEIARFKYAKEKWDDDHDHGGIAYATDKFDEGPFWRKIAYLENELATCIEELESCKQQLYFPEVKGFNYRLGSEGVYVGIETFWLEEVSGVVEVDVQPGAPPDRRPSCTVKLCGDTRDGIFLKGRALGLNFKGEKGSRVPNMTVDSLTIGMEIVCTVSMQYNTATNVWDAGDDFRFELLHLQRDQIGSFKLPKGVVQWLINWFVPELVKRVFAESIPPELGLMLVMSQQHLKLRSNLELLSLREKVLDAPWDGARGSPFKRKPGEVVRAWSSGGAAAEEEKTVLSLTAPEDASDASLAAHAAAWVGLSAAQARLFVAAQEAGAKSNKFKPIRCLTDLLQYVHKNNFDDEHYHILDAAWQQTLNQFLMENQTRVEHTASNPDGLGIVINDEIIKLETGPVVFSDVIDHITKLLHLPIRIKFQVLELDMRVEIEQCLVMIHDTYARMIEKQQRATANTQVDTKRKHGRTEANDEETADIRRAIESGSHVPRPSSAADMITEDMIPARRSFAEAVRERRDSIRRRESFVMAEEAADLGVDTGYALPSSLDEQLAELEEWYHDTLSAVGLYQALVDKINLSLDGRLEGGAAGALVLRLHQLQAQAAPGLDVPLPVKGGFYPPSTMSTEITMNDDKTFDCKMLVPSAAKLGTDDSVSALAAASIAASTGMSGRVRANARDRPAMLRREASSLIPRKPDSGVAGPPAATLEEYEKRNGPQDILTTVSVKSAWLGVRLKLDDASIAWARTMAGGDPPELDVFSVNLQASDEPDAETGEKQFSLNLASIPLTRLCLESESVAIRGQLDVLQNQAKAMMLSLVSATPSNATPSTGGGRSTRGGSVSTDGARSAGGRQGGLAGFETLTATLNKYLRSEDLHLSFLLSFDSRVSVPKLIQSSVKQPIGAARASRGHIVITQPQLVVKLTSERIKNPHLAAKSSSHLKTSSFYRSASLRHADSMGSVAEGGPGGGGDGAPGAHTDHKGARRDSEHTAGGAFSFAIVFSIFELAQDVEAIKSAFKSSTIIKGELAPER